MSKQVKHTPGPWEVDGRNGVIRYENGVVCDFRYPFMPCAEQDEIAANARLISSAPELLEELKKVQIILKQTLEQEVFNPTTDNFGSLCTRLIHVERVIAKAEGNTK